MDPLERMEIRERSESRARRVAKERKASRVPLVLLVHKVPSVNLVHLERTESPDPEVSRVCSVRKETKVPEASPDLQVPSASRGCQDLQARRERLVTWVRWVHLVLPDPEALLDHREQMDPKDPQVVSVTLELLERRVTLVKQESPDCRETSALRVQEASEERRESLVPLAPLDRPVQKVHLEMTVPKAALAQVVSPEILAPLASLALLVWMELLVTREMTERLASRVLLDPLVKLGRLDLQERGVLLDLLGLREDRERKEPRASPAWRVLLERLALLDLKVLLASRVLRV